MMNIDQLLSQANIIKKKEPLSGDPAGYLPMDKDQARSRYQVNDIKQDTILVHNATFIFTCDEHDRIKYFQNHSIVIEQGAIKEIVPQEKVKKKDFDVVYDAGKRGGTVITPGLVNAHSHIHMYLLRSAMMLDEEATVDETIAAMAEWQKDEADDSYTCAAIGDLTEQQKTGITTTLTHGPSFAAAEVAARVARHNLINAVSAVSNSRPENNPDMVEQLLRNRDSFHSVPAIALHYLYKTPKETLDRISRMSADHDALVTFHMAESSKVVEQTLRNHALKETELMEQFGLLNHRSLASHAIHLQPEEIETLARHHVGIVHLPTSNTIHKSGTFPFWTFHDANGFPFIALGTDSVVSKNRLDILTEAYQTRITHLYNRTIKFGSLFKMMTAHGARVLNLADRGRLIPGNKADIAFWKLRDRGFIPFDRNNPYTLLGNLITHGGRMVRDLMVDGKFIIKDRKHLLVDESKLMDALQDHHMQMRERRRHHNA